jgi:hypothetical protein
MCTRARLCVDMCGRWRGSRSLLSGSVKRDLIDKSAGDGGEGRKRIQQRAGRCVDENQFISTCFSYLHLYPRLHFHAHIDVHPHVSLLLGEIP